MIVLGYFGLVLVGVIALPLLVLGSPWGLVPCAIGIACLLPFTFRHLARVWRDSA